MTKTPSRFAKRMANRLAKAVGRANKQLNVRFADGMGVRECARQAANTQFKHFTRSLVQAAQAVEHAELGKPRTHQEHMLRRKEFQREPVLA